MVVCAMRVTSLQPISMFCYTNDVSSLVKAIRVFCLLLQIYVFFPEEEKVGVKTMKTYTNRMKSENVFRALLVVQQNLTPFTRTCISEISAKFHLEVFQVIWFLHLRL